MKKITFIVMITGLAGSLIAAKPVATQTRQVKGVGKTQQLAVKNALYEAVSQVQGVRVGTGIAASSATVGSIDVTREEVDKSIELEGISVSAIDSITVTAAEGLVKSYNVVNETKTEDGKIEVTVDVEVYDYQSPQASEKFALGVAPFEVQQDLYRFGNIKIPGHEVATQFSQRLTTLLNDSGKFDMLDRAYTKEFFDEFAAQKAGGTTIEQQAKFKQVLGADYLLTGRIRRAVIEPESVVLPSTGIVTEEYRGFFVAEARLTARCDQDLIFPIVFGPILFFYLLHDELTQFRSPSVGPVVCMPFVEGLLCSLCNMFRCDKVGLSQIHVDAVAPLGCKLHDAVKGGPLHRKDPVC